MSGQASQRLKTANIVLALSVIVSLIFLVFAFMKKTEADKQRLLVLENRMEAEHQRFLAEHARNELEKTREALEACQNK